MIGFFTLRLGLQKFIASMVLVGFMILQASIALAPVARAEADPTTPPPALLMRAYEGTDPFPMIYVLNSDDSGGGSWVQLPYSTFTSAEISRTDADVTIQWQVEDPWKSGVTLTNCTLYGGVAARNVPPQTGSLILHSPTPGLYIMTCHDAASTNIVDANIQLRVAGSRPPFGNYAAFSCDPGNVQNFRYKSENYAPGALAGPQPPASDRSSLNDESDACVILGIDAEAAGYSPWTYIGPPSMVDDQIGWPASRVHVDRATKARYKNSQTVTVCTNLVTTATKYRVGFTWHAERAGDAGEGGNGFDYRVYDPFEISHDAPTVETREDCVDRPLDDAIITTNIAQCATDESYNFFTTEYTYHCDTNALAANGKAAACYYETTSSVFGGIFSWILPMLLIVAGPFLAWLTALIAAFIPSVLTAAIASLLSYTGTLLDFLLTLASLYKSGVDTGMAGSVSAPDPGLGDCAWSQGFTPQTAGNPLCTSGCAFDPKTVVEGGKVNYPWNFSPAVSRFDFSCTGDLGRWSGNVPADAPYSGTAELYPRQTQSCTLTLANSAGATKTYTDAVTVTPLAGAPTCSNSFSPNRIRQGDTAIAGWKFSTDTARADYVCNGDIGSRTGMAVPKDLPYEGEATVAPGQSQNCTATVYDISGQRGSCSASITVDPPLPTPTPTPTPTATPAGKSSVDVIKTSFTALQQQHSGCTIQNVISGACNAAAKRFCNTSGYGSGFGPVEASGNDAYVTCLGVNAAAIQKTTFTNLTTQHPGCTAANPVSTDCNAAINRSCAAQSYGGGFGPTEMGGNDAYITCTAPSVSAPTKTSFAALTAQHDGCTAANPLSGACNAAIRRFCASSGYRSGFGPVEISGANADVICLRSGGSADAGATSFFASIVPALKAFFLPIAPIPIFSSR